MGLQSVRQVSQVMRIKWSGERLVVLGPGVPEGRCLEELAERCGYRVCQICDELGCSPAYFRNVFVRDTGALPKRWLGEFRAARAREFLEAGAATGEIALRLGFSCHASLRRSLARQLPELFEGEGRKFG
jgi:AraC-like DNA-binding protein